MHDTRCMIQDTVPLPRLYNAASETGGYDCMMSDFRWWLSEAGGGGDGEDGEDGEMVAECGGGDVSRVKFPVAAENFHSCALLWARRERPGKAEEEVQVDCVCV